MQAQARAQQNQILAQAETQRVEAKQREEVQRAEAKQRGGPACRSCKARRGPRAAALTREQMLIQMKTVTDQTSADREKAQIGAIRKGSRLNWRPPTTGSRPCGKKKPRLMRLLVSGSSSLWNMS